MCERRLDWLMRVMVNTPCFIPASKKNLTTTSFFQEQKPTIIALWDLLNWNGNNAPKSYTNINLNKDRNEKDRFCMFNFNYFG